MASSLPPSQHLNEWIADRGTRHDFAASAVIRDILQRKLPVGASLDSERDLAEKLGISYMTLRAGVKRLVEEGIVERRQGKGTFLVRALRPTAVAIVYLDVYDPAVTYLAKLLPAFEEVCGQFGLEMRLTALSSGEGAGEDHAKLVREWQRGEICGVLIVSRFPARQILHLMASGIPFVWVNDSLGKEPLYSIRTDYNGAVFASIPHAKRNGSRMFYVITYPALRGRHWELLFEHLHLCEAWPREQAAICLVRNLEECQEEIEEIFEQLTFPCTLYVTGEYLYHQVVAEAMRRKLSIPSQVTIIVEYIAASPGAFVLEPSGWEIPFSTMADRALDTLQRAAREIPDKTMEESVPLVFRQGRTTIPL